MNLRPITARQVSVVLLPMALTFSLIGCQSTPVKPADQRVAAAEALAMEAESAARLSAEGRMLFAADEEQLTGYDYCSLAVNLANRGEFRRSIRESSKALYLGQTTGDDRLLGHAYRDLAYAYNFAGQLGLAQEYAHKAIYHADRSHRNPAPIYGASYKVLGDIALQREVPGKAIEYYGLGMSKGKPDWTPWFQVSLGRAYLAAGDVARAEALLKEASQSGSALISVSYLSRGLGDVALGRGRFDEAEQHFLNAAANSDDFHVMWAYAGLARARSGSGDRAGALAAYDQAIDTADSIRGRFRSEEFKTGFFGKTQQIFDEAIVLHVENGGYQRAFELSERSRSRALLDMVEGRVQALGTTNNFADPLGRPRTLAEVQDSLPAGLALVAYHLTDDKAYAFEVRNDSFRGITLPTRVRLIREQSAGIRQLIHDASPQLPQVSGNLYAALVRPLNLRADEAIVVVAHGALHYVPFQALSGPNGYLIEERVVAYAPSASAYVALRARGSHDRQNLLALGNPDLGSPSRDLPGAQAEVQAVGTQFPHAAVYVGDAATKVRFVADAPRNEVVHIAAHAELDPVDPLYSAIYLADSAETPGVLEAHEIFGMNLANTQLVSLSGCETGLGRVSQGDEQWGFSRSVLSAGASTLLVSLWDVDDGATNALMQEFYRTLRTQPAGVALREAQLQLLRDKRFSAPFHWAPFDLVGLAT